MGRDREYRCDGFSVRIQQGFRELVSLIIGRDGTTRKVEGELIGRRWEGIGIHFDRHTDPGDAPAIVRDLELPLARCTLGT
jgi:hypothetical protein